MRKKLYLIPGTMCNEKLWVDVLPYLSDSLDVVYLGIPQEKNFDQLAEHYNHILGNDKVYLIGFSLGGYIATYFAMLYPKRIEKLFVISNSPTSLAAKELEQRSSILKYVQAYGYNGMSRKKVANLLDGTSQTDRLIDFVREMDGDLGESEFISQYQYTSERSDLFLPMKQFSFDTHMYYSENDRLVNTQWLVELADMNSKVSLICTAGSGHMLPLEKPRELASHINAWVEL